MRALRDHHDEDVIKVEINKDLKPGKGNFIVTVYSGSDNSDVKAIKVVNLIGIKRPFTELRELDIEGIVQMVLDLIPMQ